MSSDSVITARYDRLIILLTPPFILSQYLFFVLMHHMIKWRPALTDDAIRAHSGKGATQMTEEGWKEFSIEASQLVWSGFFHLVFGTTAAIVMLSIPADVAPERGLGDWTSLLAAGDLEYVRLIESATLMGSIFGALMLSYLFFWCVGWDKGMVQLFHHVTFFMVTILLARRAGLMQSGLVAMAMEGSSPPLNAMNVLRQLRGRETATMVAFIIFFVLFFVLRCVLFGTVVLRTWYLRLLAPDGFPKHLPAYQVDIVVILWLAGWCLQLYWMRAIIKKAYRKLMPAKATKQD